MWNLAVITIINILAQCSFRFVINIPVKGLPGGSVVNNLPAKQRMWVWPLGQEDTLEKETATHSSSCLGNPMGREASWAIVRGILESQTL